MILDVFLKFFSKLFLKKLKVLICIIIYNAYSPLIILEYKLSNFDFSVMSS